MARNKMIDLNNHLFAQLERMENEDLTPEQVKIESQRAKAITGLASQIIKSNKTVIDAMKLVANGDYSVDQLPTMLSIKD